MISFQTRLAIDTQIIEEERFSSEMSAYPLLGTIFGLAKMELGLLQFVTALFLACVFVIPSLISENYLHSFEYFDDHILHGLGNICAGFLEAIPVIGTLLYLKRLDRKNGGLNTASPGGICYHVASERRYADKWLPYDSLLTHHTLYADVGSPTVFKDDSDDKLISY